MRLLPMMKQPTSLNTKSKALMKAKVNPSSKSFSYTAELNEKSKTS